MLFLAAEGIPGVTFPLRAACLRSDLGWLLGHCEGEREE